MTDLPDEVSSSGLDVELLVHDLGDMGIWNEHGLDPDPDRIRAALPAFLAEVFRADAPA